MLDGCLPRFKVFIITAPVVHLQAVPDCMKPLIGPLLRAMHRLAKEHNQSPTAGLLSAKPDQPARFGRHACVPVETPGGQQRSELNWYTGTLLVQLNKNVTRKLLKCRLQPTEATHGSGSWFMWNALNGVPKASVFRRLLAPHRPTLLHMVQPGS